MVLGEGAAVLILEELGHAEKRGARIYGEVLGQAAGCAADRGGVGRRRQALAGVFTRALASAGVGPDRLGHVHAHGASTVTGDREEAAALHDVLGNRALAIPTVAAKSHFGNLGAGSGLVETIASLLAVRQGRLFPLLNFDTPDDACPIRPARAGDPAGRVFVSAGITPQGQAGALVVGGWQV